MTYQRPTRLCEHCGDRVPVSHLDTYGWCDHCTGAGDHYQLQRNNSGLEAARTVLRQAREQTLKGETMSEPTAPDETETVSTAPEPEPVEPDPEPEPDESDG